jgi:hypothetical protein
MRLTTLMMLLLMCIATTGWAQTGRRIAIGGSLGVSSYTNKDFSQTNPGVSFAYRVTLKNPPKQGWKWAAKEGLGWSNGKVTTEIGGERTRLGKLRTILVMGGVQRSYRSGPWQFGMGVVAGPSINHFKIDGGARDAYTARLGSDLEGIKVKNSLAVRPEISTWYDLNRWLGAQVAVSYLYNRPKAETTVDAVTTTSKWKTDHLSAHVGLVVGIY